MKSIMISIKPEWVAKILNGDKTIEIRKTMPKCELPCKVYIYCTKQGRPLVYGDVRCSGGYTERYTQTYNWSKKDDDRIWGNLQGKVVAEFTLNKVTEHKRNFIDLEDDECYNFKVCDAKNAGFDTDILTLCDFDNFVEGYGKGKPLYAWHIDDLKIYDEPRKLGEFICRKPLKRPPQSWCYIEEDK